ncbi:Endonuclease/exonuclease/phosphatase superfamily [Sesbania bispinosa]|nr:Endonuclease/exonuclease/phosphatase superfamily [Sesbania bispinosa]
MRRILEDGASKVVVCNIHVLYNPNRGEIKLGQVRILLDKAKAVSELWKNAPVVICGDFNCTPKSPLYNFISEQKLDLSGIDRDKVSGQASAIIRSRKSYGPNSSKRSDNGSVETTSTEGNKEVNIKQNSSLSDLQNPDPKSDSSENQHTHIVLDVSSKSSTNVQCGKEIEAHAGNDTQEMTVDHNKIFDGVDSVKEEPNPSYSKHSLPSDHIKGEVRDITPMTSSALERLHTDTTGMGSAEHISDAIPTSNQESSNEKYNLHDHKENRHTEFDCSPTSLQEDDQSSRVKKDLESTDLLDVEISSTKPSSQISASDVFEVPHPAHRESPSEAIDNDQMNCSSTSYDKSHQLANIDFPLDEKLEKSFLDKIDKAIIGSENFGEDDNAFITALHNAKEAVAHDLGPLVKSDIQKSHQSEELDSSSNDLLLPAECNEVEDDSSTSPISRSIDAGKTTYNPSLWTPMEIETATGNAECTFLEHPLPLRSTYTEAMDCSGTRDPHGEPLVTSYNRCFLGTVDYIWRSGGLQTTRVLAPIPKHAMERTPGFPTKKWGSDHIALVSELAFLKDGSDISKDV